MKQLIKQTDLLTKFLLAFIALGIWALLFCFYFAPAKAEAQQQQAQKQTSFDAITVHRINVTEPDGTLRMVISDKTMFPGIIYRGKEYPHPGRNQAAGMLFFNDEGTENGGLIYAGMKNKDGKFSHGHLSFDRYEQDQIFSIDAGDENGKQTSALRINDQPDYPLIDVLSLSEDELKKFSATHPFGHTRIYLGRDEDASASLKLKDTEGRNRIIIQVGADGSPMIQFLDKNGKVTSLLK